MTALTLTLHLDVNEWWRPFVRSFLVFFGSSAHRLTVHSRETGEEVGSCVFTANTVRHEGACVCACSVWGPVMSLRLNHPVDATASSRLHKRTLMLSPSFYPPRSLSPLCPLLADDLILDPPPLPFLSPVSPTSFSPTPLSA